MLSQQDLQAWLKPTSEQGYFRIKVDNARRKCCLTLQSQLEAIDCGHHATFFNSYSMWICIWFWCFESSQPFCPQANLVRCSCKTFRLGWSRMQIPPNSSHRKLVIACRPKPYSFDREPKQCKSQKDIRGVPSVSAINSCWHSYQPQAWLRPFSQAKQEWIWSLAWVILV